MAESAIVAVGDPALEPEVEAPAVEVEAAESAAPVADAPAETTEEGGAPSEPEAATPSAPDFDLDALLSRDDVWQKIPNDPRYRSFFDKRVAEVEKRAAEAAERARQEAVAEYQRQVMEALERQRMAALDNEEYGKVVRAQQAQRAQQEQLRQQLIPQLMPQVQQQVREEEARNLWTAAMMPLAQDINTNGTEEEKAQIMALWNQGADMGTVLNTWATIREERRLRAVAPQLAASRTAGKATALASDPSSPDVGVPGARRGLTRADIAAMSPEEYAKRADEIFAAVRDGALA